MYRLFVEEYLTNGGKQEPLRFLVVVAHPHDFTHCSGTCGIHINMGDSVTVVTMTDGGMKHNELQTSDDFQILEVSVPAKMDTVPCDPPA